MSYISGVRCEVCGTIIFFEGKQEKDVLFHRMKLEGWRIVRKSGMRAERTYCPIHYGKEYEK